MPLGNAANNLCWNGVRVFALYNALRHLEINDKWEQPGTKEPKERLVMAKQTGFSCSVAEFG